MASLKEFKPTQPEQLLVERRRLGLNQSEMAAQYGITLDVLLDWEKGRRRPLTPARRLHLRPFEVCMLLRKRCGHSQTQMAELLGVSRVLINQMEVGKLPADRLVQYWEGRFRA